MEEILQSSWTYPAALALISVLTIGLEWAFKLRREQRQLRARLWSDVLHLVFNGHFLGVIIFGIANYRILPHVDAWLAQAGWIDTLYRNAATSWPIWLQVVVALFAIDFVQWGVHNALHRIPWLWEFHKTHHSVVDGEMDWMVSFRFQWAEVVVYRTVLFVPLAWFGFGLEAIMFHAIFGTLIGHLNHANLDWDYGPLRYVLNSPRMHIWHHDFDGDTHSTVNFGIIFSIWDWVFGTAKMPDAPPARLGFEGVEAFPKNFFGQMAWPLNRMLPTGSVGHAAGAVMGFAILAAGYAMAQPPRAETPMLGETASTSRPAGGVRFFDYARNEAEASARLDAFGSEARALGFAHPELMVSTDELASALGSERLVLLDVRPRERFLNGHLPSAQSVDRADYSWDEPAPGVSRPAQQLRELLRSRGVSDGDIVVAYGDGGPEPYRLWWTLRVMTGLEVRVLDGGMAAWSVRGHGLAAGEPKQVARGNLSLSGTREKSPYLWTDVAPWLEARAESVILDTRSRDEFVGHEHHPKAARAGRIPGAVHLDWWTVWRDGLSDQRLMPPDRLRALAGTLGIGPDTPVMTMCQSGTRSSVTLFGLLQAGHEPLLNYDGSWAEYSRMSALPVTTGEPPAL